MDNYKYLDFNNSDDGLCHINYDGVGYDSCNTDIYDKNKIQLDSRTELCQHNFHPAEKGVFNKVEGKKDNIARLDKDQYSFNNTPNDIPLPPELYHHNYTVFDKKQDNIIHLKIRPGVIYDTINNNCRREMVEFFKNAGKKK